MEDIEANDTLRGILTTHTKGFRKLQHYGNPDDWGDWAPHIAKNTADPNELRQVRHYGNPPQILLQVVPRLLCCQVGAASPGNEKVKPRTFIARVGAFAEESKTNNELRGILQVSEEGFREPRHVGNPENWGNWAPYVRGNTADPNELRQGRHYGNPPKYSYRRYRDYYAAKAGQQAPETKRLSPE